MARLVGADLRARWGRSLSLALAIGIACAALALTISAAASIRKVVVEDVIEAFPATEIEVQQRLFAMLGLKLANRAAPLDEAALARIKQIPGVKGVIPEVLCRFPAAAVVSLLGNRMVTDTCTFGVTRELVEEALPDDERFAYSTEDGVLPAVISKSLLQVFNSGYASARKLPKLDEALLIGLEIDLHLGVSMLSGDLEDAKKHRVRIVGLSPRASLVGVSVPMGYADEWNRWWYSGFGHKKRFRRVLVQTTSPRLTDEIAERIENMGFQVASGKAKAEDLNAIATLMNLLVAGLCGAVVLLAGVGVLNAAALDTAERVGWIGLLRTCGATRSEVVTMLLCESAIVGFAGGTVGAGIAWACASRLDTAALARQPTLGLEPGAFFGGWWQISLWAAGAAMALAALSALWPALRAAHMAPADALAKD